MEKVNRLESKITLVFEDGTGRIEVQTTLSEMLTKNTEDYLEALEGDCMNSGCNNETQNFCDCGDLYSQYKITDIIL